METWQIQLLAWMVAGVVGLPFTRIWRLGDGTTRAVTFGGALLLGPYFLVSALALAGWRWWRDRP